MSGNPLGVDLYHGAVLNVSVVNNTLNNNGGIELVPTQRNAPVDTPTTSSFSVARNIEINNNTLINTSGQFSTFIAVTLQLNTQNAFWGESVIGVEVRNNKITARSGAPYYRNTDGYKNLAVYQSSAPYVEQGRGALTGTVFQGDTCANCAAAYTVSTGAIDTTIWNPVTTTSPGIVSMPVTDWVFPNTTTRSLGTVVGHD